MFSGKQFINTYILPFVDNFHFIHPGNPNLTPCLGEQVTQSTDSGSGRVPLVSIQTYLPASCRRSISASSIQSEGSPL